MSGRDRPWRTPLGREARNEQAKLRASLLNAAAIAFFVAGLAGPILNPQLVGRLGLSERAALLVIAWAFHSLARFAVRGMEDKA